MASTYSGAPTPPWGFDQQDERRFRKVLAIVLGITLLLSLVMPLIPVSEPERDARQVPPRLAKLVIEQRKPAPRPEPKSEPEEKPRPEPEAEPVPEPEPKADPDPEPKPEPEPKSAVERAREKASKSGVLAFGDELSALEQRDVSDAVARQQPLSNAGAEVQRTEREIVTSKVDTGSGGIDTDSLSRDAGGGDSKALKARETTRVESPVESAQKAVAKRSRAQQQAGIRTDEEIQLVFDRNKSAFYRLYRRALRKDPTLQGTVVVKLTIAPSGQVTEAEVVSSELDNPGLERRIELRVMQLDFGAQQVQSTTVEYPIDFFPS